MRIDAVQRRTLLVLLGLAALFALGVWWPEHRREQSLNRRIDGARAQLAEQRGGPVNLASLARDLTDLRTTLAQAPRHLSQESELADVLRQLGLLLAAHRLGEQQVVSQSLARSPQYQVLPLTVTFRGAFPDIFAFVQQLESLPRVLRIMRLDIDGQGRQPGADLRASLDVVVFFAPQEAQP